MNGIDSGSAALVASRVNTLNPVGSQGSAGAAQAGVSALNGGAVQLPEALVSATPQASAQTELSAVGLALDAIIRSGGEATPAVVGSAPVWSDPSAAQAAAGSLPLAGIGDPVLALEAQLEAGLEQALGAGESAEAGAGASTTQSTQAAQSTQSAQAAQAASAAQSGPIAALAQSLQQTVANSGLFYESHLAQWLTGQRSPADLADEPQNRLVGAAAQLPLDWSASGAPVDDVLWSETPLAGSREAQAGAQSGENAANSANAANTANATTHALAPNTALVRANGALADAALLPPAQDASAAAPLVHAAVIPLVRQQLDLLATGEFRWTGEAWPGVRLDWNIEQERVDARDAREQRHADADDARWRTRLTLALPSLGTVDAELTLAGQTLAVRVQASEGGAARLVAGSDALRSRLEALGLALAGLSIREIGAGTLGAGTSADAAKAASAYARAAAQEAKESQARADEAKADAASAASDFDWDFR
jgi:hypothetical protein